MVFDSHKADEQRFFLSPSFIEILVCLTGEVDCEKARAFAVGSTPNLEAHVRIMDPLPTD